MITDPDGKLISSPVWVDFMRTDWERRVRLDLPGTRADLDRSGIDLVEGRQLVLYTEDADSSDAVDDLVAVGLARYDEEEGRWVAEIDWAEMRHVSELPDSEAQVFRKHRFRG